MWHLLIEFICKGTDFLEVLEEPRNNEGHLLQFSKIFKEEIEICENGE